MCLVFIGILCGVSMQHCIANRDILLSQSPVSRYLKTRKEIHFLNIIPVLGIGMLKVKGKESL